MYTPLKVQSYYSFLRGASSPESLVEAAYAQGLRTLALTDWDGVYGLPKAWKRGNELGIKILCGAQLFIRAHENPAHRFHRWPFILIPKNKRGYGFQCELLSKSHIKSDPTNRLGMGRDEKGKGALLWKDFLSALREGPIEDLFFIPEWEFQFHRANAVDELLYFESLRQLKMVFHERKQAPAAHLFIPTTRFCDGRDDKRAEMAQFFSSTLALERIAHNDVLYAEAKDKPLQDVLTCIREGLMIQTAGFELGFNCERYLKSPAAFTELFWDDPEAISNTERLAAQCTFDLGEIKYQYPSEWIPTDHTSQSYLRFLCEAGIKERYPLARFPEGPDKKVLTQLEHELGLIQELNYADYFLTVYDIVDFARSQNILCQGRGSAANSVVCYVLGVTAIAPVEMNLLFERFISVERGEPPDIDVDFEHDRREEVIQYIYQKYGRHRAAMVATIITFQEKSALRDVAKVFGVNIGTLSAREVGKFLQNHPETPHLDLIYAMTEKLLTLPRHLSIHSGGFTLSAEPLFHLVPIEPASMPGRTVVQWDKDDLDILGLLKVDVLALGMLAALRRTLDLVGMKLHEIPPGDIPTYDMICEADTIGTFQIESRAQMAMLPRLKPREFYDLVIEVALVRPGPIVGQMVHPYLKRRRREEIWEPSHPGLEEILGRTYGVPIFQEQVMKLAIRFAGFTAGEADHLRKSMGTWKKQGVIDQLGMKLKQGLLRSGFSETFSEQIFKQIQGFSEYGFPESHAASFASLAYASCYLKRHYPAAFLVALLNSQPLGFYASHSLIDDAKRHDVVVHPVSLHGSTYETQLLEDDSVLLGYQHIHKFGVDDFLRIAAARDERAFTSVFDFISRTGLATDRALTCAKANLFSEMELSQRDAYWQVLKHAQILPLWRIGGEKNTVNGAEWKGQPGFVFPTLSPLEAILSDYETMRLSTQGHPMHWIRARFQKQLPKCNSQSVKNMASGSVAAVPGLSLVLQRPPTAAGTAFATLEDEFGLLDLICPPAIFEKYGEILREEPFVIVTGRLQKDGLAASFVVQKIKPFEPFREFGVDLKFSHQETRSISITFPDAPGSIARRH